MRTKRKTPKQTLEQESIVPDGAPDWITNELLVETLETWQPYYGGSLTVEDAL